MCLCPAVPYIPESLNPFSECRTSKYNTMPAGSNPQPQHLCYSSVFLLGLCDLPKIVLTFPFGWLPKEKEPNPLKCEWGKRSSVCERTAEVLRLNFYEAQ